MAVGDFQGVFSSKLRKKIEKEKFDFIVGVGDYGGIKDWRPWLISAFKSTSKGEKWISPKEYFGKKKYKNIVDKDFLAGKKVLSDLNGIGKKVLFVFGNSDDDWYNYIFQRGLMKASKRAVRFLRNLKNLKDMNYKNRKYKEFNFVGFGGYHDLSWYLKGNKAVDMKTIIKRKKKIKKGRENLFLRLNGLKGRKIFVLHYPPKGVFDIIKDKSNPHNGKSSGIEFFTEAIKKYKPELVLCGHMHEYQGAKKLGKSLVVNPGDAEKGKYAVVDIPEGKGKIKVRFIK